MQKKVLGPGLASAVVGGLLGLGLVLGITAAVQQNTRPDINRDGNKDSSLLNQVEYGTR